MSTCWDTEDRIKKVPKTIEKRGEIKRDKIENGIAGNVCDGTQLVIGLLQRRGPRL